MLPIRDHIPSRTLPIVTAAIVAANVAVFIYQLLFVSDLEQFFYMHGMVPCLLTGQCAPIPGSLPPVLMVVSV